MTLDDVSSLFHLSIIGRFWTTHVISLLLACLTTARDMGVAYEAVLEELGFNMGVIFICLGFEIGTTSLLWHKVIRLPLGCTCYI